MRVSGEKMLYADQWAQGVDSSLVSLPDEHIGSLYNKSSVPTPTRGLSVSSQAVPAHGTAARHVLKAHGTTHTSRLNAKEATGSQQTNRPAPTAACPGDYMCCTTAWVRPVYGDWVWKAPSVCGRTLAAGHDGMWSGREEGFWHQPAYRVNRALFPGSLQVQTVHSRPPAAKAVPTTSHDAPSGVRTDSQGNDRCHGNGYIHLSTSRPDVKQTTPSCAQQLMTKKGAQPAWTARHDGKHHPDMRRHGYTAGNKRLTSRPQTLTSRPTPLEVLQKVKSKRAVGPKASTKTKRQHSVWSSDSESESSDDECWCLECFKCRLMGSAVPHEDRLAVKKEIAVKQQSSLGRDSVSSSPQFFNDSSRQGDTRTETSKRVHSDSTSDSCKRIKLSGQSYEMTSRDSCVSSSTDDLSERSDVTDSLGRWQESRCAPTNERHVVKKRRLA